MRHASLFHQHAMYLHIALPLMHGVLMMRLIPDALWISILPPCLLPIFLIRRMAAHVLLAMLLLLRFFLLLNQSLPCMLAAVPDPLPGMVIFFSSRCYCPPLAACSMHACPKEEAN